MVKSFLVTSHKFVFVLFLFSIFISGCFPFIKTPPPCPPAEANIYRTEPPRWWMSPVYTYAYPTTPAAPTNIPDPANPVPSPTLDPTLNQKQLQGARYAAFQYLIEETRRWSKIETVKFSDSSEAEIVVTFISPSLLQAVFLNDTLNSSLPPSQDFQAEIRNILNSVATREELLFTMTVTSPGNLTTLPNHTVKLPIDQLTFNNAAKIQLPPNHSDFNLGQPINTSSEAVFGYVGYPLAKLLDDGKCIWALDQKYTEIVLSLPAMEVDGNVISQRSWTIPYTPLLGSSAPTDQPPNFNMPEGYENIMTPRQTPPSGILAGNQWQEFARFIWAKTTLRK